MPAYMYKKKKKLERSPAIEEKPPKTAKLMGGRGSGGGGGSVPKFGKRFPPPVANTKLPPKIPKPRMGDLKSYERKFNDLEKRLKLPHKEVMRKGVRLEGLKKQLQKSGDKLKKREYPKNQKDSLMERDPSSKRKGDVFMRIMDSMAKKKALKRYEKMRLEDKKGN